MRGESIQRAKKTPLYLYYKKKKNSYRKKSPMKGAMEKKDNLSTNMGDKK